MLTDKTAPRLSVIIPAHNEAGMIGECLHALFASDPVAGGAEVIVVANGCQDTTVAEAEACRAEARDWTLTVLDLPQGGKPGALNAGEAAAQGAVLAYLDADVLVSPPLLRQINEVLDRAKPGYASGQVVIPAPRSAFSRLYAGFYRQVPFFHHGVPGCGLFAMNREGRARWGHWPGIISDDTFARLNFAPQERHAVPARYDWPIVEGFGALVRVRRRQDAGVAEIARHYPALLTNDDARPSGAGWVLRAALRAPLGFLAYIAVALAVRARRGGADWTRGR
ncbi:Glycosyltransferase involved in cell wall biogenesis [Roseovarius mucosus DSM 17069]|uniref:Glycosyltransferase involved in cell wall biogenesis n=1 Tax=Roseovarius mucosus DSM 17069 TaxID=1288298 RepID=A0A0A0HF28_9RHOB|nr:glycosyltransferase [Roseovarius mucosus]KGM86317.1 Glycosyltransferase involved in cell wall biogenesis [Roseovarius mucosus DSM 17069]